MYKPIRKHYSLPEVNDFIDISRGLDLATNAGGSRMSDYRQTLDALRIWGLAKNDPMFPGVRLATFVVLEPSSQIVAHCDPPIVGIRHHIPLLSNDGCWSFHDGVWQQLSVGQVYAMDPTKLHGAVNWGASRRLHLIIDLEP